MVVYLPRSPESVWRLLLGPFPLRPPSRAILPFCLSVARLTAATVCYSRSYADTRPTARMSLEPVCGRSWQPVQRLPLSVVSTSTLALSASHVYLPSPSPPKGLTPALIVGHLRRPTGQRVERSEADRPGGKGQKTETEEKAYEALKIMLAEDPVVQPPDRT